MDSSVTVSVALCTHNGELFIAEQIRSILEQGHLADELVISDDASTDGTVTIARSIIDSYLSSNAGVNLRVVIIENPVALGVAKNFEGAITACSGDLVALSDQDDVWHRDKLEVTVDVFRQRPNLLALFSDARLVDSQGSPFPDSLFRAVELTPAMQDEVHAGHALDLLLRRNIATGATMMIRRALVKNAVPFPAGWLHDEWLAMVGTIVGEIDLVSSELVDYRQHGGNQVGAQALSLRGKLARLLEPGAERNRTLLLRADSLVGRIDRLTDLAFVVDAANQKLEHERVRAALSTNRLGRIPTVLRELRTGRYSKFGRGTADAVRDLIQPL
jgi:hypothetical protein